MTVATFNELCELKRTYIQAVEAEAVHEAALMDDPENPLKLHDYEVSAACCDRLREKLRLAGVVKW